MSLYKKFAIRGMIVGGIIAAVVFAGSVLTHTKTVNASDTGDCGASSIVTCGVKNVDEILAAYDSNATVRGTYNNFISPSTPQGITRDMIVAMKTQNTAGPQGLVYDTPVAGAVDGVTRADGLLLATSAVTAGRVNVTGSTTLGSFGGVTIYKRAYHLSNHSTKQAFILMDGNKFVFGILAECGNPVTADTSNVTQNKEVSKDGANFAENATFTDGETATFRVTVHETTGKGFTSAVRIADAMPAGFTLVPGTTRVDGQIVGDISGNLLDIGDLAPGATRIVSYQAVAHIVTITCGTSHIVNTSSVSSDQTNATTDTATADVTKACPVITATCNSLTGADTLTEGQTSAYTVAATATNTTISSIAFSVDGKIIQTGMGTTFDYTATTGTHTIAAVVSFANGAQAGGTGCAKTVTVSAKPVIKTVTCVGLTGPSGVAVNESATYIAEADNADNVGAYVWEGATNAGGRTATVSFDKEGTYTIKVTITPAAGVTAGASVTCQTQVKVSPLPAYTCDVLTAVPTSPKADDNVTYTVNFTAHNGATFKAAHVDYGDNTSTDVTTAEVSSFSVSHIYPTAGTYDVTATPTFTVNGETVAATANGCATKVTVAPIPVVTVVKCRISGKENFDASDSKNCVAVLAATTTTPSKLADTGAGDVVGIFAVVTILGAALHNYFVVRRRA